MIGYSSHSIYLFLFGVNERPPIIEVSFLSDFLADLSPILSREVMVSLLSSS